MKNKGLLIIVSAPSGTGKGAIIKQLIEKDSNIRYSISATTREPRNNEVNNINYFFVSRPEFEKMIINKELIEWDEYVGNYYGTPKIFIEEMTSKGLDVILEITVEGALNVKELWADAVMIFLLPPSLTELRKRILGRNTENIDLINKRLEKAEHEMEYVNNYEYVVINDNLDVAVNEVLGIIKSERLKYNRNRNILKGIDRRKK